MKLRFKMHGGTGQSTGTGLCQSCSSSIIRTGSHGETRLCMTGNSDTIINSEIYSCSRYSNRDEPNIYDLKEIAWTLDLDTKGRAGFKPPSRD